ncbi:aminoacetone oxidase family FAD-binding enzyme [Polynucleobacter sp. Fuers-14]|jgi:predicted Rossmann fold flavoprotein|uniref:NAD(P)/FAD-dependent oxidoreductase n=1 Tax=Polynucleobacter sp. Fuers-14 TaxID=1758364 RepID=UPI001C0BC416|nr:aminoacetone oxidase family FAD-binding enzyme [Polynucleobacter sp. Fuers-14]MBU3640701.1 aminoacetone oxidase family FAD-binding enzyme [Polynucleobacter sp. Fuers-14]
MSKTWDAIIIGGGAAGLFCAGVAGQLGKKVLVLDHAEVLGEKIRISGGGRCNFTNLHCSPANFLSLNQHFVKSALARYPSTEFIKLVTSYGINYHEKHQGQLFCDESAKQIIDLLFAECAKGNVTVRHPVSVQAIEQEGDRWSIQTNAGTEKSKSVVMATGGLPVPAIGATAYSLDIAKQFGLNVIDPRPALVPLSFTADNFGDLSELAGLAVPVRIASGSKGYRYGACRFNEDLLLTHKGLSGPAVLQASSYWEEGEPIHIDWLGAIERPGGFNCDELFNNEENRLKLTETILASVLPQRLAKVFAEQRNLMGRKWAEVSKKDRQALKELLTNWSVKPAGTLGWKKAEVMLGGVDTKELDGQTMMSRKHQGLFFIGECVDVTGHLGGHNFQWAWASGYACAQSL